MVTAHFIGDVMKVYKVDALLLIPTLHTLDVF